MRYLRTNTAVRVTVGPFLDKTDGVTPETAITVTSDKLTFVVDDGNVPTLILDTAPTASGGANDMVHITGDDSGFYDLELAAANVNYLGRAMLSLNDAATHCPVFHEFMILPAVVYDAMVLGTDLFDVSMTQILGTAVSTPATAGILDINLKNIANSTVSTSSAQLGVNAVQAGATAWGSGAITAASIAADAITAAKIADGAIDAATFAAGAITAAAIAADAIGASELAADAATEIATAVWASATRNLTALGFTLGASDLAADTIGASELAADAVAEIAAAILTTALTESYRAVGAAPTLAQAVFELIAKAFEGAVSGTTLTTKKVNQSTTAGTYTLDSGSSPTSITRAT